MQVLQTYLSTVDKRAQLTHPERVEMSEIELYMATVMREGGQPRDALRVLNNPHSHICDPVGRLEMQARRRRRRRRARPLAASRAARACG